MEEAQGTENHPPPPPPPDFSDVEKEEAAGLKVNVIKPFKPSPRVSRIVPRGKCFYHPTKPASYICASCSKSVCSMCGTNLSGVYFCPQCAPYKRATTAYSRPAPIDNTGWYRAMLSIGIILVIIGSILAVAYWPLRSMNAAEFENLWDKYLEEGAYNIEGYANGDIIVIRDNIIRMEILNDTEHGVITRLRFESTGKGDEDYFMDFDASLEKDYDVGDEVAITLHIERDWDDQDEVIRELHNTIPDLSNIDHTLPTNLVFYALIVMGGFLAVLSVLFTRKAESHEGSDKTSPGGGTSGETSNVQRADH